jgi:hypothetical protein
MRTKFTNLRHRGARQADRTRGSGLYEPSLVLCGKRTEGRRQEQPRRIVVSARLAASGITADFRELLSLAHEAAEVRAMPIAT